MWGLIPYTLYIYILYSLRYNLCVGLIHDDKQLFWSTDHDNHTCKRLKNISQNWKYKLQSS